MNTLKIWTDDSLFSFFYDSYEALIIVSEGEGGWKMKEGDGKVR